MANVAQYKTALTGGAANALDSVDGDTLTDGDPAFVFASNVSYFYILDADSGLAESSPSVISPDTNAGTKRWILQYPIGGLAKDYITGLIPSNDTDTDHDISISAGKARDATDAVDMTLSSAIVKQIDAAWAVGTNQGGLDTGTVANSTIYHLWLIKRSDTGVVDVLFSTSGSSPTMPTNYDYKRWLGWVLTDGSANILTFKIQGDGSTLFYIYNSTTHATIATGLNNNVSWTAQSITACYPSDRILSIQVSGYNATGSENFFLSHLSDGSARYTLVIGTDATLHTISIQIPIVGNQFYYICTNAYSNSIYANTALFTR